MKQKLLEYLFKKSPVALSYHKAIFDENGIPYDCEFLDVSNTYENMMGLKDGDVIGKRYNDIFKQENLLAVELKEAYKDAIINNKTVVIDVYNNIIKKWIKVTIFLLDKDHFACVFSDISKEYMKQNEIDGVLKININMLCVIDGNLNFVKVNKEFENVLGYDVEEFERKNFLSLVHKNDLAKTVNTIRELSEVQPISGFINRMKSKDGTYKYLEWYMEVSSKYLYASLIDVTEKLQYETKSNKNLMMNEVNGVLNIDFFNKRIIEEIERADRYNDSLAMIILSLENFKKHELEYSAKEDEIVKIAQIIGATIRKYDILARIEDEEFLLLLPKTNINNAIIVAEKIRKNLNENVNLIIGKYIASFGVSERIKSESIEEWKERLKESLIKSDKECENFIVVAESEENLIIKKGSTQWKSEWESGNGEIDKQHKELLGMLNDLINLLTVEINFEKGKNQLEVFVRSILKHFEYEEEILANIKYKDYDKHCKIHKNLIGKLFQLKEYYFNKEINVSAFLSFISDDVIIGHMINEDMKYFDCLKK